MDHTPGTTLSDAAAVHRDLIRIGRAVRSRTGHGPLSPRQMSALWSIAQHAPIRATELADREGVAGPTMSRVVACLEQYGMVARTTDPHDGRVSLLTPTDAGLDYIHGASSRKSELFEQALARLDDDARNTVCGSMHLLADLLCDLNQPAPDPGATDTTRAEGGT